MRLLAWNALPPMCANFIRGELILLKQFILYIMRYDTYRAIAIWGSSGPLFSGLFVALNRDTLSYFLKKSSVASGAPIGGA